MYWAISKYDFDFDFGQMPEILIKQDDPLAAARYEAQVYRVNRPEPARWGYEARVIVYLRDAETGQLYYVSVDREGTARFLEPNNVSQEDKGENPA
jgi:hypothetical protein